MILHLLELAAGNWGPTVFLRVEVGTDEALGAGFFFAELGFVVLGVVELLFPPVREEASFLLRAAFCAGSDERARLPTLADLRGIIERSRCPPEVLPVVRVNAFPFVVLRVQWTPFSLEQVQEEGQSFGDVFDQSHLQILDVVSE